MSVTAGEAQCPKCGRARTVEAVACARCGLTFALWTPGPAGTDEALDGVGAAMWAALPTTWGDESAHDTFAKHCAQSGRLGAAGRAYRAYLDGHPGDAMATRMQARIVGMATAALLPARTDAPPAARKNWLLWVVVVGAVTGAVAALIFKAIGR